VLRHPQVTSALIGASSVAQLDDNLDALDGPALDDETLQRIEPHAVHGTGSRR
jgi:L-glyceraldehyde 3-phosphate reductase